MKTLEQEAKEYALVQNNFKGLYELDLSEARKYSYDDFLAGTNSKWVQAEKIKAQIEVLTGLYQNSYIKSGREFWKKKFEELEQQHRQLEDE